MLYDISLRMDYEYSYGASEGRHLLHLMPAQIDGLQRVIAGRLDVQPHPAERTDQRDFFLNRYTAVDFREAHDELVFTMHARVERLAPPEQLDVSPPRKMLRTEVETLRGLDGRSPLHFTGDSTDVAIHAEFREFALAHTPETLTVVQCVHAVGRALHDYMTFDSEATEVDTPPLDAFRLRRGVCQDYTHILIACLRSIGIPAGYVSGYLRTIPPPGKPPLEGADAMHAWVMAWCGTQTGWIEYDPTNDLDVRLDHIAAACGRDYFDVAPVKGISRMSGKQKTSQAVDVRVVGEPRESLA